MRPEQDLRDIASHCERTDNLNDVERLVVALELIRSADLPVRPEVETYLHDAIEQARQNPPARRGLVRIA